MTIFLLKNKLSLDNIYGICMESKRFQGSRIPYIPKTSGIYAWYYKPRVINSDSINQVLSSFFEDQGEMHTEIKMRYGKRLVSESDVEAVYGASKASLSDIIGESLSCADVFLQDFFKSDALEVFTRPIYIGIAKNLHDRIYKQHYSSICEMWEDDSSISKFLSLHPNSTPQQVVDKLGVPHSFALEARVRKISARDLGVHIFETKKLPPDILDMDDESSNEQDRASRRALEKLLQLISDPICGRQ